jgi:hypothetical protein
MEGTNSPLSSAEPYDFTPGSHGHSTDGVPVTVKTQHATDVSLPTPWPAQSTENADSLVLPESMPPDPGAPPAVAPDQWLEQPRYWLADYQHVPRPKTRPLSRPIRFRKVSPIKSAIRLVFVVALVIVLTIGLALAVDAGIQAGTTFVQQFTTPPKPLVTPTTAPVPTAVPTKAPKKK